MVRQGTDRSWAPTPEPTPEPSEPTIDPFPASCSFPKSQYNPDTDTCGSGTHISELQKVHVTGDMYAYADASGHKLIPVDEGIGGVGTMSGSLSLAQMEATCDAAENCRALATDDR